MITVLGTMIEWALCVEFCQTQSVRWDRCCFTRMEITQQKALGKFRRLMAPVEDTKQISPRGTSLTIGWPSSR
jgi:hypothetical protein